MEKCCIFKKGIENYQKKDKFLKIKSYGEIPTPNEGYRYLLQCKECNSLFLYQTFSWNVGDIDDYFNDLIQVNSEEEADRLNDELKWNNFSSAANPTITSSSGKEVVFKNI